jgi:hypothetical protein
VGVGEYTKTLSDYTVEERMAWRYGRLIQVGIKVSISLRVWRCGLTVSGPTSKSRVRFSDFSFIMARFATIFRRSGESGESKSAAWYTESNFLICVRLRRKQTSKMVSISCGEVLLSVKSLAA